MDFNFSIFSTSGSSNILMAKKKKPKQIRVRGVLKDAPKNRFTGQPSGRLSAKDPAREELRQRSLKTDPKFAESTARIEEEKKVKSMAQRNVDIDTAEEDIKKEQLSTPPPKLGDIIGKAREPKEFDVGTRSYAEGETAIPLIKGLEGLQKDIINTENKLAQPETGGVLDSINRWRLGILLANTKEKLRKTEAGELQPYGAIEIGLNPWGIANIGKVGFEAISGRLSTKAIGVGQTTSAGGLMGLSSIAKNAKNTALTGVWLKRLGFTTKAAVALGSLIGLTAWGKHVKSEAIEFLPFQISMAREAGDEAGARELEELHAEIADPTGWANIIEEIPGLGVIKAAIDKTRVGTKIIEAQKRRT